MPDEDDRRVSDPFMENGLRLSPTAAEAKQKVLSSRNKKRAPPMDWNKRQEIFSNFWTLNVVLEFHTEQSFFFSTVLVPILGASTSQDISILCNFILKVHCVSNSHGFHRFDYTLFHTSSKNLIQVEAEN